MQVCVEAKADGCSIRLSYDNGKLIQMATRGDGVTGDDITPHAQFIRGIPQEISYQGPLEVRGEIVLPFADFESYWKPQGAKNPRNTVSGCIKGRSTPEALATLQFIAYDLYNEERGKTIHTEEAICAALHLLGFQVIGLVRVVNSLKEAQDLYLEYDKPGGLRDQLPYMTDGLVMRLNRLDQQEALGVQNNRPVWATAIKPSPKSAVTRVTGIIWSMGLSGRFSPVAQLEPADLDGTQLRQCNMFNVEQLEAWVQKGFGIGAIINVIRTGDVLPYLTEVLVPAPVE